MNYYINGREVAVDTSITITGGNSTQDNSGSNNGKSPISPQTGYDNSVMLVVAIVLFSGAAVCMALLKKEFAPAE